MYKENLLVGSVAAPGIGELIPKLILANSAKVPIKAIFNKIYPYPVATCIVQEAIVEYKREGLTKGLKKFYASLINFFADMQWWESFKERILSLGESYSVNLCIFVGIYLVTVLYFFLRLG